VHFSGLLADGSEIEHAEFILTGKINRADWGLTLNESTGECRCRYFLAL
jgi:hypothetical protein